MKQVLNRYGRLLTDERCVHPNRVALTCRNDVITCIGPSDLATLAMAVMERLPSTALVVAEPLSPYSDLLQRRASCGQKAIVPRDSESRSSLHDIPLVQVDTCGLPEAIASALARRKGCIVNGIGMVSHGALTVEQAYIGWSSLYHATFIKYLEDLLSQGPLLFDELAVVERLLTPLPTTTSALPDFRTGPLCNPVTIMSELAAVGRATVTMGLVDSFFGNISYAGQDALYISQTSARLDELDQQIDPIPYDDSSTAGITASSELPAHCAIFKATGCRAILHGHPRFPVVMSFFSTPTKHEGIDQVCGIPVVGGEGGQGGLAESLPRAFKLTGKQAVIVRGHGVFSIGQDDFRAPFATLVSVERACHRAFQQQLAMRIRLLHGADGQHAKKALR